MKLILSVFVTLAILAGVAPVSAQTTQSAQPGASMGDPKDLAEALRAGGFVMLVRHGATFSDQADIDPFNLADIAKQRNLNDKGKALAKAFGEAIRAAGVPVGGVYTSQFNRAYETAVLAGFKDIETTANLSEGGLVVSPDENNRRAKALRDMLARVPDKGKNTFSSRTNQTSSTLLGRIGSTSRKAKHPSSSRKEANTACLRVCRWRTGPRLRRPCSRWSYFDARRRDRQDARLDAMVPLSGHWPG